MKGHLECEWFLLSIYFIIFLNFPPSWLCLRRRTWSSAWFSIDILYRTFIPAMLFQRSGCLLELSLEFWISVVFWANDGPFGVMGFHVFQLVYDSDTGFFHVRKQSSLSSCIKLMFKMHSSKFYKGSENLPAWNT